MQCNSCGAEIFFVTTTAGKRVPVNHPGKIFFTKTNQLDERGSNIYRTVSFYESHFSTCPNADQHRKPNHNQNNEFNQQQSAQNQRQQNQPGFAPEDDLPF